LSNAGNLPIPSPFKPIHAKNRIQKKPFATYCCKRLYGVGGRGLEPPTPSLSSNGTHDASGNRQALTPTPFPVCTSVCTSEPENANADALEAASLGTPPQAADVLDTGHQSEGEGTAAIDQSDPLTRLAAELGKLSQADRQRLAAMLAGQQGEGTAPRP
jgi:hypothetical protein